MSDAQASMPFLDAGGIDTDPESTGQITIMPKPTLKGLAISMSETLIQHLYWIGKEYNVFPSHVPGSATKPVLMEKLDDFSKSQLRHSGFKTTSYSCSRIDFNNLPKLFDC